MQILTGKQAGQVVWDGLKSLQSRLPSLEAAVGLSAIALVYIPFPSWQQPDSHDQPLVSCLGTTLHMLSPLWQRAKHVTAACCCWPWQSLLKGSEPAKHLRMHKYPL